MGWIDNMLEQKLGDLAASVAAEGQRTRLEMSAGLAQTVRGLRIDGALYKTLSGVAQSRALNLGAGRLFGWSVLATAGPVRITFHDGASTAGDVIGLLDLADQEHDNMWFGATGVSFADSLYMEVTGTGTGLLGAVYLGAVD